MTRQETQIILEFFARSYPMVSISDKKATVELWASAFVNYDFEVIKKVAQIYVQRRRFFPSIAEIKTMADKLAPTVSAPQLTEGIPKTITIEDSGCLLCPYYDPGQRDFCDNCMFEGNINN